MPGFGTPAVRKPLHGPAYLAAMVNAGLNGGAIKLDKTLEASILSEKQGE